ncbi:GDP-L-fucose synthetase [Pyrrhoderma noxium]|uniref:GDP-L-fucose synthase n=1 Tax=Pyrrhoderma noxium TaxID=2282107 RepID=A0A286UE12_9AGAM|nr:GDP-L-fucose synthetase [Pyrrhoderma noxium]
MSKKVVLVTGGNGLVGRAIKEVALNPNTEPAFRAADDETWVFVSSKDGDLRDPAQTEKLFETYKPTHIIHLAAIVGGLYTNMSHNLTFLRENLLINDNVLHCAHKHKVSKVISCLSTCVFPDEKEVKDIYPLTEKKIHLGSPHPSNFGYSHAKRLIDVQNRAYRQEFGCNFTSAIPTNVFGKHDNFDLEESHVIPGLIHKCYLADRDGLTFRPMGSGKPLRQFIYSVDLAKLFVWMLRNYDDVEPLILSVPEEQEVSIKFVVEGVVKALEKNRDSRRAKDPSVPPFDFKTEWNTQAADGQFRKPASNAKLASLLEKSGVDFKFTKFEDALQDTVDWFVENYDKDARIGKAKEAKA